ncbi:MAG: hypothetical protein LBS96_07095 [Oscillospiraceae bacterium]|jgi:hypothetical protein|nr:hypothetical protein [Oscillospiraceae bacterium]
MMTERVMSTDALQAFLIAKLHAAKVMVRETDDSVILTPVHSASGLLGIAAESSLTVEKFLEMKQEERTLEYEREQRLFS